MNIFEKNKLNINKRISLGLDLIRKNYEVKELDTKEFEYITIQNMNYSVKQYEIKNVGNLLVMKCEESDNIQMDSFVITPYYKNIPLFSTDYIYVKEKRTFLNEIYSLVSYKDDFYAKYVNEFSKLRDKYKYLNDMPMKKCWYDDLRPVCIAKNTEVDKDDEIINIFIKNLKLFIKMEKETPILNEEQYKEKWIKTQEYTNGLIDNGGVSTDVFKAVLGVDKTREFFNRVFFAPELYKR